MKMRATQNIAYGTADGEAWIHGGAVFDADAPEVKAFPDLFEPVYETVSNPAPEPAPVAKAATTRRRRDG